MMGREHLRNIALVAGAEVVAIHEPDSGHAGAGRRRWRQGRGILQPAPPTLLGRERPRRARDRNAPNHTHVEMLEIAGHSPSPADRCWWKSRSDRPAPTATGRAHRATGPAPVWVAMEYRYMPPMAALIAAAPRVTGGIRMLTIREHRFPFLDKVGDWNRFNRNSGGTLVEKCCHFFDLMRLILADEPVRVMASAGQAVNHKDERYNGEVPDVWDAGYVIVDFARGGRAMLELCMFADGAEVSKSRSRRSGRSARSSV